MRKPALLAAVLVVLMTGSARATMVAHWALDDAPGSMVAAEPISGYLGLAQGVSPTFGVPGVAGTAASSPHTGWFKSMTGADGTLNSPSYTMSGWINSSGPTTYHTQYAFGNMVSYPNRGAAFRQYPAGAYPGGSPRADWNQAKNPIERYPLGVNTGSFSYDDWYFAVGRYDAGTGILTTDLAPHGGAWASRLTTSTSATYSPPLQAVFSVGNSGTYGATTAWSGSIDDVQYYDVALGNADVEYLFNNPGQVIASQVPPPPPPPPTADPAGLPPIAHWRLDDAAGSSTVVEHISGFNGVANGTPTLGHPGVAGTAMEGNGADWFKADGPDGTLNSDEYTVTGWINSTGTGTGHSQYPFGNARGYPRGGFNFRQYPSSGAYPGNGTARMDFAHNEDNGDRYPESISQVGFDFDEWYFAAAVYDGDTVTTYLIEADKAWEFGVVNSKSGMTYRPGPAYFGLGGLPVHASQSQWDGLLDDVQYYDYSLTVGNLRYLFENPGEAIGAVAVPEPSTFALAALGLLSLSWIGLRRRRQA